MYFPVKTFDDIVEDMKNKILETTTINDFSPGSIVRTFVEVFGNELADSYIMFDFWASQTAVSTATDAYLDLIGKNFNCERNPGESDDNYRYRIIKQSYTNACCNETALRLACLQVDTVKDVILTNASNGSGSFSIHVITDDIYTDEDVLEKVRKIVEDNKAYGIFAVVARPVPVPMDITVYATLNNDHYNKQLLSNQILESIQDYLDQDVMGANINIQKIESIINNNENIKFSIPIININNNKVNSFKEYQMSWDERIFVQSVTIEEI